MSTEPERTGYCFKCDTVIGMVPTIDANGLTGRIQFKVHERNKPRVRDEPHPEQCPGSRRTEEETQHW